MAGVTDDSEETEKVKARLDNGAIIHIEVTPLGGKEKVASLGLPSFSSVTDAIEGIAQTVVSTLRKVNPRAASVEFGLEIGLESGQLTALLIKGTGTANLKITLEWGGIEEDSADS